MVLLRHTNSLTYRSKLDMRALLIEHEERQHCEPFLVAHSLELQRTTQVHSALTSKKSINILFVIYPR